VDNDSIVLAHSRALLTSTPEGVTACIDADGQDTAKILTLAAKTLHFSQPIAVMLLAILPFIPDADDPWAITAQLMKRFRRAHPGRSLRQEGITEMPVPVSKLVIFLIATAVLGLIAAGWPARRAAKLDVLSAIATE
jgi:hypothetical protein